jgi:hypothetical protein
VRPARAWPLCGELRRSEQGLETMGFQSGLKAGGLAWQNQGRPIRGF